MKIISETASIQAPISIVFEFLSQAHNIECLLPDDKISDFHSDTDGCTFKVQGGFLISLLYVDKEEPTLIRMKSGEKAPFTYSLTIHLIEEEDQTNGHIEFVGNVNMFLKMMVEKPLIGLFNHMSGKLQEQFYIGKT
ncbi:MAG: hypothetical protein V4604_14345 [Bacteroidota bacterium]